jgi:hypothetical protein
LDFIAIALCFNFGFVRVGDSYLNLVLWGYRPEIRLKRLNVWISLWLPYAAILVCEGRGHSRLGYHFLVSKGKRIFLGNFTCFVCLDLYCKAYFGSYLHFIHHIHYINKVNLDRIGPSKISFWFLKGHLGVLSYFLTLGSRN